MTTVPLFQTGNWKHVTFIVVQGLGIGCEGDGEYHQIVSGRGVNNAVRWYGGASGMEGQL